MEFQSRSLIDRLIDRLTDFQVLPMSMCSHVCIPDVQVSVPGDLELSFECYKCVYN